MEKIAKTVKKKGKKKWIAVTAGGVAVILIALIAIPKVLGPESNASTGTITETTVKTGNISTTVEASGNIADNEIQIEIPYGVTVSDIEVDEGDYVNDGDKLVTLSSSSLDAKIEDVEDEIDALDDKIDEQEDNSENVKALKERKSELNSIKKSLNKLDKKNAVYSSGNGTIGTINISESSSLSADDNSSSASSSDSASAGSSESTSASSSMSLTSLRDDYFGTAMTIDSNDTVAMEVDIDELDISSVKKGQDATITLDAVEGEEFSGKVTKINSDISISNGTVKYSAKIELEKTSDMKTGMSADATIIKEAKENVLTLPADAINENGDGLFVYTSTKDDELGGKKEITTGLSDGTTVEILSGLSEGDTVYYLKASGDSSQQQNPFMMQSGMPSGGDMPSGGTPPSDGGGQAPPQNNN